VGAEGRFFVLSGWKFSHASMICCLVGFFVKVMERDARWPSVMGTRVVVAEIEIFAGMMVFPLRVPRTLGISSSCLNSSSAIKGMTLSS